MSIKRLYDSELIFLPSVLCTQESLHAHSEYSNSDDNGTVQRRINQYIIKQEIGRGSCGSVHIAVDQYGQEYVRLILSTLVLRIMALFSRYLSIDH